MIQGVEANSHFSVSVTGGNSIALGLWRPQLGLAGLNQTRSRACLRSADQTCRETYIRAYIHASQGATTGAHRRGYKGTERRRESACTCSRMQMQMHSLLCTHMFITSNFCITSGSGSPAPPGAPRRRLAGCRVIQTCVASPSRASRRCPAWLWFDDIWPASSSSHPTPTFVLLYRTYTDTDSHTTYTHTHTHTGGPNQIGSLPKWI